MNPANTKGTPVGPGPSSRSGAASASSKHRTPTGESNQKPSYSVDRDTEAGQMDEIFRVRNARKSVGRFEKTTPTADFAQSSSKNRVSSTAGKEKASNTSKKSPLNQPEKELTPVQSGKKAQDLAEEQKSGAKSKPGSMTKPQSSSKAAGSTPNAQQSRLDFGQQKLVTKSADKNLEKDALRRSQGKQSTQSDVIGNRGQSGTKKVVPDQSIDADELEDLLEDENAKVQVTAQKSREPSRKNTHQGASGAKGQQRVADRNEEEDNEPVSKVENVQEPEEGKVERKEYSVYEDWRILETIEALLEADGAKSLGSRNLWATAEDPATGRRLLDGKRSSESMRDRYKRYISALDDVGKDAIREFCKNRDVQQAKAHHCLFKKVDKQRQFTGISKQTNYDPDRITRKTPYGTKSKKSPEKIAKKKDEKKKGTLERDFEEEDIEEENEIDEDLLEGGLEDDIEQITQTQTRTKLIRDHGRAIVISEDTETFTKGKPMGFSMTSTNFPGKAGTAIEQARGTKKRKALENEELVETGKREMKKVKQNKDYENRSTTLNGIFNTRRPTKKPAAPFENIMICVDLDQGFRQFVKQEFEEEEEEEEDEVEIRLRELAQQYGVGFAHVAPLFSRVSCDFDDLEEYLLNGDERVLWTEEEDGDLLNDNKKAIKYLRSLKGDERIQKRKEFLLATLD